MEAHERLVWSHHSTKPSRSIEIADSNDSYLSKHGLVLVTLTCGSLHPFFLPRPWSECVALVHGYIWCRDSKSCATYAHHGKVDSQWPSSPFFPRLFKGLEEIHCTCREARTSRRFHFHGSHEQTYVQFQFQELKFPSSSQFKNCKWTLAPFNTRENGTGLTVL